MSVTYRAYSTGSVDNFYHLPTGDRFSPESFVLSEDSTLSRVIFTATFQGRVITAELIGSFPGILPAGTPVTSVIGDAGGAMLSQSKTYVNGVLFNDILINLPNGTFTFKVRNLSDNASLLSSQFSNEITIERIAPPNISVQNQEVSSDITNVLWFINGELFDLNFKNLDPGNYFLSAITLTTEENKINSSFSNIIEIIKLQTPEVEIIDNQVVLKNAADNIQYFLNGELFDLNFSNLLQGIYQLQVQNLASNYNEFDSNLSDAFLFSTIDVKVTIQETFDATRYIIKIEGDPTLTYNIEIKFYNDELLLDQKYIEDYDISNLLYELKNRNSTISNSITLTVFVIGNGSTYLDSQVQINYP